MAENKQTKGRHLLTDKDFVDVVDAEGNDLPPVPKHWTVDDLPAGAKFKTKSGSSSSSSSRSSGRSRSRKPAAKKADTPPAGGDSDEKSSDDSSGDGNPA